MRMKGVGGGEIVQVQGGHIVRSTGRKDRHSKVYTAKGPRDRRVRLSAHTAIQFYDVQDRLGYDRPSKAVDWLIKKAKSAIDKLAELPSWHPTGNSDHDADPETDPNVSVSGEMGIGSEEQSGYGFQLQRAELSAGENTDFIADTMKSFFPTTTSVAANSSMNFQNYPQDNLPTQDLGLSLHCFQEQGGADHAPPSEQAMFGSVVGFGSSGYQRMVAWNGHDQASDGESRGFAFQAPPPQLTAAHQQALLGQGSAATPFGNQRGTLQSSFSTPLARDWDDLPSMAVAAAAASQRPQQQHIHQHSSSSSSSIFGTRFVSYGGGLPVFRIPARIHGVEEDGGHGVVSERPSSSSSPNSAHN